MSDGELCKRRLHGYDVRETFKPSIQFIPQKYNVINDIFVRPFARGKIFGERKKLSHKHRRKIGSRGFGNKIAESSDDNSYDLLFDRGLRHICKERNDVETSDREWQH